MNTGHESALRILRTVMPTRELFDPSRSRLKYVRSENTDIARTFRKFERLAAMKAKATQ